MQPFDVPTYHEELLEVAIHLEPFASTVSVRGDGAARFVYAESNQGSIEVSKTEHLEILVEFWRPGADASCHDEIHRSYESAIESAVSFLRAA